MAHFFVKSMGAIPAAAPLKSPLKKVLEASYLLKRYYCYQLEGNTQPLEQELEAAMVNDLDILEREEKLDSALLELREFGEKFDLS